MKDIPSTVFKIVNPNILLSPHDSRLTLTELANIPKHKIKSWAYGPC